MVGVLSHYISQIDITKAALKKCEMVLLLTFAFALQGGRPGGCFCFHFLGTALFSRINFFGMRSLFWGAFWASIFFNGTSNSPTSSSLWPSSSSSLSSSSLNSSLSVSFLLFHWSNGKTFDHTKLWWELIQTRRHNTFRRDIVAEICSLWARISWASWCCKGEYFLMEWEAQWLWIGSGTEWLWVWFWSYFNFLRLSLYR